jgi:hypothetical protein
MRNYFQITVQKGSEAQLGGRVLALYVWSSVFKPQYHIPPIMLSKRNTKDHKLYDSIYKKGPEKAPPNQEQYHQITHTNTTYAVLVHRFQICHWNVCFFFVTSFLAILCTFLSGTISLSEHGISDTLKIWWSRLGIIKHETSLTDVLMFVLILQVCALWIQKFWLNWITF